MMARPRRVSRAVDQRPIGLVGVAAFAAIALAQHRLRKIAIDEVAPALSVEVV